VIGRAADAIEIDRWAETPVTFTNSRWLQPIDRFREDLYLYSPKGAQYTADGLRARWGRWLADTPEGRELCRRWKQWVGEQVKKYEWDIDPDDADHPTIHGLRGTGSLARSEQGYEVDQIANDIGMSRQNVEHYIRFKDQMKVEPTAKNDFGSSTTRTRPRTSARLYQPSKSPGLQNPRSSLQNFRKNSCKISYFGGEWCNGSTTDSDSVCLGSNPSSPAILLLLPQEQTLVGEQSGAVPSMEIQVGIRTAIPSFACRRYRPFSLRSTARDFWLRVNHPRSQQRCSNQASSGPAR
jgi:hypothetical protein